MIELSDHLGAGWRFRGRIPTPEEYAQSMTNGVLAQFIVFDRVNNNSVGFVSCYKANFGDGNAYIAGAQFNAQTPSLAFLEGAALFLEYVFHCWNFHKLYFDIPEYNATAMMSGISRLFKEEARLIDHQFMGGKRWSVVTLAVYRSEWMDHPIRPFLLRRADEPPRTG